MQDRGWAMMGHMCPCGQKMAAETSILWFHPCLFAETKWDISLRVDSFIA